MREILAAVVMTLMCACFAMAAGDTMTLPAKNGDVKFDHKKHQDMKGMTCTACHESAKGGKIAGLNKDWAHKTCKGCHEEKKQGPTKCGECHKK